MSTQRLERGDAGVTLIELLISVMILGIVTAAIFGTMTILTRNEALAQRKVENQEAVRQVLLTMARDLRSSTLLVLVPPADAQSVANEIEFTRADGVQGRWRLVGSSSPQTLERQQRSSGVWVTIASFRNITNGATTPPTPLIRYYGAGNQRLDPGTTPTLSDLSKCALRLRLTVRGTPPEAPTYSASQDVALRNRGSRGVSGC